LRPIVQLCGRSDNPLIAGVASRQEGDGDAHEYIGSDAGDPAQALLAMGGAKAIIATVTDPQAMEAIAGGLGENGMMMVSGAVGNLTVGSLALLRSAARSRVGTRAPPPIPRTLCDSAKAMPSAR
jgi:hypothetical protein